jgi:hypothetical protein
MIGYHTASSGSIILEAFVSTAPFIVIAKALKDFFGGAFKNSQPYLKAQEYITNKINELATKIFPVLKVGFV